MKKLLTICLLMATVFAANAQDQNTDEMLDNLNQNTISTERQGSSGVLGYSVETFFTDEGCTFSYSYKSGRYTYEWAEVAALGITSRNRVYLAFTNNTFEYITPKPGVNANNVLKLIDNIAYLKTNSRVRLFGATLRDEMDIAQNTTTAYSGDDGLLEKISLGLVAVGALIWAIFSL